MTALSPACAEVTRERCIRGPLGLCRKPVLNRKVLVRMSHSFISYPASSTDWALTSTTSHFLYRKAESAHCNRLFMNRTYAVLKWSLGDGKAKQRLDAKQLPIEETGSSASLTSSKCSTASAMEGSIASDTEKWDHAHWPNQITAFIMQNKHPRIHMHGHRRAGNQSDTLSRWYLPTRNNKESQCSSSWSLGKVQPLK